MTARMADWQEVNHAYVLAQIEQIRELLLRASGEEPGPAADMEREFTTSIGQRPALEHLCDCFRLSPFERGIVVLCAGFELCPDFGDLCARVHDDTSLRFPTFSLAAQAIPGAHWSAFNPSAALRRWRMIELGRGETLTSRALTLDERVLHYILGVSYDDERVHVMAVEVDGPERPSASEQMAAQAVVGAWVKARGTQSWPLICVSGDSRHSKRAVAARAAASLGLRLRAVAAQDIPQAAAEREAFTRLCEREAILSGFAVMVESEDDDALSRDAARFAASLEGMVVYTGRANSETSRPTVRVEIGKRGMSEDRDILRRALGVHVDQINGDVDAIVSQFRLEPQQIQSAVERALSSDAEPLGRALWRACRDQARPALNSLAQPIETGASWDDLVLPPMQIQLLREIGTQVRRRSVVYESWGLGARTSRGLGISALFAGPSGTGKTLAAEVLATDLDLDLHRVDLSQVVNKYIGETEKNLKQIFDAAEAGGTLLLLDEADALFGKRTDVRDSNDRFANIEISYLLQRMETYRGLAILTTNLKPAIDTAFLRRIRFIVHFPFPDQVQRVEIWRRALGKRAPMENLNFEKLARLNVAGGNIRNISLNAAFLAADASEPIRMSHLLRAARSECAKIDKQVADAEVAGWV
jgi:hypothetical protein